MNNTEARVLATGLIWIALTILGVALMVTDTAGGSMSFMLATLIGGGTIGTAAIWRRSETSADPLDAAEKAKRRTRVDRLMERLDEHDLDELRYRLMNEQIDVPSPQDEVELVRTGYRE